MVGHTILTAVIVILVPFLILTALCVPYVKTTNWMKVMNASWFFGHVNALTDGDIISIILESFTKSELFPVKNVSFISHILPLRRWILPL